MPMERRTWHEAASARLEESRNVNENYANRILLEALVESVLAVANALEMQNQLLAEWPKQ